MNLIRRLLATENLRDQTADLNVSQAANATLDLIYQLLGIAFGLMPVALALFLLTPRFRQSFKILGLDRTRPGRDLAFGAGLAALIGIPGLGLYAVGRVLGLSAEVVASGFTTNWWTFSFLHLAALRNEVLED